MQTKNKRFLKDRIYTVGSYRTQVNSYIYFVAGAIQFARTEGLIPAPEPTHAIAATIREALHCRETGESKVILTAMCGHGHFDLPAYEKYLQGNMVDLSFEEEKIKASLANIPQVVAWGEAIYYIAQQVDEFWIADI